MGLLIVMDPILTLLMMDIMIITVPPVVVMLVHWMIHMVQAQKSPHLLSLSEGLGKIDEIGLLYKSIGAEYDNHKELIGRFVALSTINTRCHC